MLKKVKRFLLPVVFFVLGLVCSFLVAQQLPINRNYSPSVKWVIENPEYAERVYSAYEQHIKAAEEVLMEELGNLSGEKKE